MFGGGRGDAADRSVAGVTAAGDLYRWFRPAYLQGYAFIDKFAGNLFTQWRAAFPLIGLVRDFSRNSKFIQEVFFYLVQVRLREPWSLLEHFNEPEGWLRCSIWRADTRSRQRGCTSREHAFRGPSR